MKTFRSIAAVFVFAAFFAVAGIAQTQSAVSKIGVVNTLAFDDAKGGIAKYVNAMNSLETELKPDITELQNMAAKLQTLQTEIENFKKQLDDPKLPPAVDKTKIQTQAQAKYDEYTTLNDNFQLKQKQYKAKAERREQTVMGPIRLDIGNALQEFAKKNGFMMILDAAKLDGAGLLLAFDEKYDITKDFITFYNARPATTAVK
ncbi:MAG: OmpH family outer membrane protein [Pyrinomonadaceae bacterium]